MRASSRTTPESAMALLAKHRLHQRKNRKNSILPRNSGPKNSLIDNLGSLLFLHRYSFPCRLLLDWDWHQYSVVKERPKNCFLAKRCFSTVAAEWWNITVAVLAVVRELALRHRQAKQPRKANGLSHHRGVLYVFVKHRLPKVELFYLCRLARARRISAFFFADAEPWAPVI